MTLQIKKPCVCTFESYKQRYFPCPYCNETKETHQNVWFDNWDDDKFKSAKDVITDYDYSNESDCITCICGDEIFVSGGEIVACSCGRVYKSYHYIRVDESHLGDTDYLIKLREEQEEERNKEWKLWMKENK